jgi:hypothetical protein
VSRFKAHCIIEEAYYEQQHESMSNIMMKGVMRRSNAADILNSQVTSPYWCQSFVLHVFTTVVLHVVQSRAVAVRIKLVLAHLQYLQS